MQSPSVILENLATDFKSEFKNISGPITQCKGDTATLLYSLVNKDVDLLQHMNLHSPLLLQSKVPYFSFSEAYEHVSKYPYVEKSDLYAGETIIQINREAVVAFIADFLFDRKYTISLLSSKEIKKMTDTSFEETNDTASFVWCIAQKPDFSISFTFISGFVSENDIENMVTTTNERLNCYPSTIIETWATIHY